MKWLDWIAYLDVCAAFGLVYGLTAVGFDLGWLGLVLLALIPVNVVQFARKIATEEYG